jgi:hypothetical protein
LGTKHPQREKRLEPVTKLPVLEQAHLTYMIDCDITRYEVKTMSGWDVLYSVGGIVAMSFLLVAATVVFIIGFSQRRANFLQEQPRIYRKFEMDAASEKAEPLCSRR